LNRSRNFKDLTGNKYHYLTVLELNHINERKEAVWKCRCECGNEKIVTRSNLLFGGVKSCGCIRHDKLIGKKFGSLVVLEKIFIRKQSVYWKCQCDCGKQINVRGNCLNYGQIKTCGYCKSGRYITGFEMSSYRSGAKSRGLLFDITTDDVDKLYEVQNKKCALSGIDIIFNSNYIKGNGKIINGNASIDRIDSGKGYTKNNIQLVDKHVNKAKWDRSQESFIEMCCRIADYQRSK
jgi:hypothetical protein